MVRDRQGTCPPLLALERYAKGELDGSGSRGWRNHIEACADCQKRIETLSLESEQLRVDDRWRRLSERLDGKPLAVSRPRRGVWMAGGMAATLAAASVALIVMRGSGADRSEGDADRFTAKGGADIEVTLLRAGQRIPFEEEDTRLRPGDTVQLDWRSPRSGCLALFLAESGEPLRQLFPKGTGCAPVAPGTVPVGDGLTVDGTTKDAVIWGVFGKAVFDTAPVVLEIERGSAPDDIAFDGDIVSVSLKIVERRD